MKLSCATIQRWLPTILDGEQAPFDINDVERHLLGCSACRSVETELRALHGAIARTRKIAIVPPGLRLGIEQATQHKRIPIAAIIAAAAALLLIGVFAMPASPPATLINAAVVHHRTVLAGTTPLDIETADVAKLSGWFNGRIPFQLALPHLSSGEFAPRGGRLIEVAGNLAAYVWYKKGEHNVGLAVALKSDPPSGGAVETFRDVKFHFETVDGLRVIRWTHGDLSYALVSDLPNDGRGACQVCHGAGSGLKELSAFSD